MSRGNRLRDVAGLVVPMVLLLASLAVVGAPAAGVEVAPRHLAVAALGATVAVAVLVVNAESFKGDRS